MSEKQRSGRLLGMPYNVSRPTVERLKSTAWDPDNPRLFVPKAYGWGYSINFGALARPFRKGK